MNRLIAASAGIAALMMTATGASAGGYYQNGTYVYGQTTYTAPSYTAPAYTAPTVNVGPIEYAQPQLNGSVTYTQPVTSYARPATTTTYAYPAQPSYTTPSYGVPSYTAPAYVAPTTTYTAPVVAPSYGVPSYLARPAYDGTGLVRSRIRNQRDRIRSALDRGELTPREEERVRGNLRDIRRTFRSYRDNDGVIGRYEEADLMERLNRNSRRIARVANNRRNVYSHGPYYR